MSSPCRQMSVRRLPPLPNQITTRTTLKESGLHFTSIDSLSSAPSMTNSTSLELKAQASKGKHAICSFIITFLKFKNGSKPQTVTLAA